MERQPGTGPSDGDVCLDEVGIEYWGVIGRDLAAKGLDVEGNGRPDVGEGLLVGVALAADDALQAEGVGHEAIGVCIDQGLSSGGAGGVAVYAEVLLL